jgi:predicted nucleotide-binding protein
VTSELIPVPVVAAVAHYYSDLFTHAELDILLDRAEAAQADSGSSKKTKIRNRLEATNKRREPPPLVVLGLILEEVLDGFVANRSVDLVNAARSELARLLASRGLQYQSPRRVVGVAATQKNYEPSDQGAAPMPSSKDAATKDPRSVFIIYGRNHTIVAELRKLLFSVGLRPLEFDRISADLGNKSSIFEIVREGVSRAQAVIALFTPDELAVLQTSLRGPTEKAEEIARFQPRPNVLYEAGLAFALNPNGTVLVSVGNVAFPSDLAGIHYVKLSNNAASRKLLLDKLEATGATIESSDLSYLDTTHGDFSPSNAAIPTFRDPFAADAGETAKQPQDATSKLKQTIEAVSLEANDSGLMSIETYQRLKTRLVTAVKMLGAPHVSLAEELNRDNFASLGTDSEKEKSDTRKRRLMGKIQKTAGLLEALA